MIDRYRVINRLMVVQAAHIVMLVCAVVLVAGFVYSVHLGDELRYSDEYYYHVLVTNLLDKGIYTIEGDPTAAKPPGYVFFLWLLGSLGGDIFIYRYVNFLLLVASFYLIYRMTRHLSGPFAGALAVTLLAGYGVLFYTASTLYPQTLASFLFIAILAILSRDRVPTIWESLLVGALFAWLILTVLTFAFALVGVALWLALRREWSGWHRLRTLAIMVGVVGLTLGLWTHRNYQVFDRLVLISTQSDAFLTGNSPNTRPNDGPTTDISAYRTPEVEAMDEGTRDAYFREQALTYIRENPLDWIQLYMGKVVNHFNVRNDLGTVTEESPRNTIIMIVTYVPLLLAFGVRVALMRRFRATYFEGLLIVLYVAAAFYTALVFTRIRYRLTYDMLLIVVVALFIARFEAPARRWLLQTLNGGRDIQRTPRHSVQSVRVVAGEQGGHEQRQPYL